jgi:hypothetical protein
MKKSAAINIKTALLLFPVIVLTKLVDSLPWWSFVIPVLALGIIITLKKWNVSCFIVGFLTGFLIWAGASLYFDVKYDGVFLDRLGIMPKLIILLGSGMIGGVLTGLALFIGRSLALDRKVEIKL